MNSSPVNPLLEQFLSEARDLLENTGKKLLQLEDAPNDKSILDELFRCVHTLKGNSGLFTFPEMTRVLHAGEDLLGMVRSGHAAYSRELADQLLEAMDLVGAICGDIGSTERIDPSRAAESKLMTEALRKLMPGPSQSDSATSVSALSAVSPAATSSSTSPAEIPRSGFSPLASIPEGARLTAIQQCRHGDPLHWISYRPERECFFHGDDPLNSARQTPGLIWGHMVKLAPLPPLAELDTYSCLLGFDLLSNAPREELDQYYRYLPDQVEIAAVLFQELANGQSAVNGAEEASSTVNPIRSISDDDRIALEEIVAAQRQILLLDDRPAWHAGRLKAVAEVLVNLSQAGGEVSARADIQAALAGYWTGCGRKKRKAPWACVISATTLRTKTYSARWMESRFMSAARRPPRRASPFATQGRPRNSCSGFRQRAPFDEGT